MARIHFRVGSLLGLFCGYSLCIKRGIRSARAGQIDSGFSLRLPVTCICCRRCSHSPQPNGHRSLGGAMMQTLWANLSDSKRIGHFRVSDESMAKSCHRSTAVRSFPELARMTIHSSEKAGDIDNGRKNTEASCLFIHIVNVTHDKNRD
jgi:hypothetical protein